jgi:hypothetical protein
MNASQLTALRQSKVAFTNYKTSIYQQNGCILTGCCTDNSNPNCPRRYGSYEEKYDVQAGGKQFCENPLELSLPKGVRMDYYMRKNLCSPINTIQLSVLSQGTPSVPTAILFTLNGNRMDSGRLSWTAPVFINQAKPITTASLTDYSYRFYTKTSANRWGIPLKQDSGYISNGLKTFVDLTTLHPGAEYYFTVKAKNSSYTSLYGDEGVVTGRMSIPITSTDISGLTFSSNVYTHGIAYAATSNTPINKPIVNRLSLQSTTKNAKGTFGPYIQSDSIWYSDVTTPIPIHRLTNYGSTEEGIMTIQTSLTNGSSITKGPSYEFHGFPALTSQTAPLPDPQAYAETLYDSSGIYIKPGQVKDKYTIQEYSGFFMEVPVQVGISKRSLIPSPTPYTFNMKYGESVPNTPISDSLRTQYASLDYQFYVDDVSGLPIIDQTATNVTIQSSQTSNNSIQISGVTVYYDMPNIQINTEVSNMGNYFYSSPCLTYDLTINNTPYSFQEKEIGPSNIISLTGQIVEPCKFTYQYNPANPITIPDNTFLKSIDVTVTAHNLVGQSTPYNLSTALQVSNFLMDRASYIFAYGTLGLPQPPYSFTPFISIPTVSSNSSTIGRLISAGKANTKYHTTDFLYNNAIPWRLREYDNTKSLVDDISGGNLQICNGAFRSIANAGLASTGYLNYTTYSGNSTNTNYTSLNTSEYRHAAFVWECAKTLQSSYSKLQITITGIENIILDGIGTQFAYTKKPDGTRGEKLDILYRFEDFLYPDPFMATANGIVNIYDNIGNIVNTTTSYSTIWLDANNQSNKAVSGANFNVASDTDITLSKYSTRAGLSSTPIYDQSTNTLTIMCDVPGIYVTAQTSVYLYVYVGGLMSSNFAFKTVNTRLII